MKLELPDDVVSRAEISARELRLALATQLYSEHRIDHDDACLLAGVLPGILNRELAELDISIIRYPKVNTKRKNKAS
jgi:predicted HTH domain antitoxin